MNAEESLFGTLKQKVRFYHNKVIGSAIVMEDLKIQFDIENPKKLDNIKYLFISNYNTKILGMLITIVSYIETNKINLKIFMPVIWKRDVLFKLNQIFNGEYNMKMFVFLEYDSFHEIYLPKHKNKFIVKCYYTDNNVVYSIIEDMISLDVKVIVGIKNKTININELVKMPELQKKVKNNRPFISYCNTLTNKLIDDNPNFSMYSRILITKIPDNLMCKLSKESFYKHVSVNYLLLLPMVNNPIEHFISDLITSIHVTKKSHILFPMITGKITSANNKIYIKIDMKNKYKALSSNNPEFKVTVGDTVYLTLEHALQSMKFVKSDIRRQKITTIANLNDVMKLTYGLLLSDEYMCTLIYLWMKQNVEVLKTYRKIRKFELIDCSPVKDSLRDYDKYLNLFKYVGEQLVK